MNSVFNKSSIVGALSLFFIFGLSKNITPAYSSQGASLLSPQPTAGYGLDSQANNPEEAKPLADSFTKEFYPEYPPLNPPPGKEALAKEGEYLAKMGDCIACHSDTKKGMPAYAGGLPLNTPFGTFYSPNITPDKETGIGNWTEQDFVRAMKEGRDPAGRNYFPVFPYIYFAKMTEHDARALYAYFMSIPPVKQENKSMPFPFNMPGARLGIWGWNLLFFFPEGNTINYDTNQSPAWNRGRYIVDTLGHCSMCHTPLNLLGGPKNRYYLTGAFVDGYWSPNITKHGLSSADPHEIANVFKENQLINNAGPVAGPMAEVNHNSLSHLTEEDRLAIATYLKTVVSEETLKVGPSTKGQSTIKRGRQVYVNSCIICHQNGEMGAPVIGNGSSWYQRLKTNGIVGLYRHAVDGYNSMPVKGGCVTCSDNDVIAGVDYLLKRSLSRSQWQDVVLGDTRKYPSNGKAIYDAHCAQCHNDGVQGAPKIGSPVWKTLAAKNVDVLISNTINSKKHPKLAPSENCTTGEVIEAIKYMLSQSDVGNYSLW